MENIRTALNAVLTYRVIGSPTIIEEVFTPNQRDALQLRIDCLRSHQATDSKGEFIPNQYSINGMVDYMVVSYR